MYPKNIKEPIYSSFIEDLFYEFSELLKKGIKSLKSPKSLAIFLEKWFHF